MSKKKELSVMILSWNNIDTIYDCIRAVETDIIMNSIEAEIHIVDNGSTDGTEKYGTIKNKENRGISIGKNQGIDASTGKYVFMLDADVIPVPNSIISLLRYMRDNPKVKALGFYPNKWTNQRNKDGQRHHETYCNNLYEFEEIKKACIYYGIFRRTIFIEGLRFDTKGAFGESGYGWEDHDFYEQMCHRGIKQYATHINGPSGKYFHAINSSIRAMGRNKYIELYPAREKYFKDKWGC